jgi:hypothetical protein
VSRRITGLLISALGVAILAVALFADSIGVGNSEDFGWKQLLGVVAGLAIAALGYVVAAGDEEPGDGDHTGA